MTERAITIAARLFDEKWAAKTKSFVEAWDAYDEEVEIIHTFIILYNGWEMDNEGWVIRRKDGTLHILMTSHGGYYVSDIDELNEKLIELDNSRVGIETAIHLINQNTVKKEK